MATIATSSGQVSPGRPPARRLNVFSLDPSADIQLDTAPISRSVISVPWEDLGPGPVGAYVEVVDIDPSSGCAYDPVELDHPFLLAQDGYEPSTGNPQFHQQMVYAVAMRTIKNFEQALGREVMWAGHDQDEKGHFIKDRYVPRLRIYPHALRDQNAYYSPAKKALLLGYFHASASDPRDELPDGVVFTCLSQDIVAHETTHAILDGIHPRLLRPSNEDMLAFHEAFADIVAIFQHFTLPGLLLHQIERTRGYLQENNILAQLAVQFARATNRGGALRNALGEFEGESRVRPDPSALGRTLEPHERGAILVAAVFDAFLRIHDSRIADLRRIATGGTGVLPEGDIHPDLARRFAHEAARAAQRVLTICIRAVDYLPPVDITFGDYLRALITADADFFPADPHRYRLAFIEAFRERGIYPLDVRALAEDSLHWRSVDETTLAALRDFLPPPAVLRTMACANDGPHAFLKTSGKNVEDRYGECLGKFDFDGAAQVLLNISWHAGRGSEACSGDGRNSRFLVERLFAGFLHDWIKQRAIQKGQKSARKIISHHLGLDLQVLGTSGRSEDVRKFEVHAVRPTIRLRPDGRSKVELLVLLTQRVRRKLDSPDREPEDPNELQFKFRGGCTLLIDPETGCIRYAITKSLSSEARLERNARFFRKQIERLGDAAITRFGLTREAEKSYRFAEPFALAHAGGTSPEGY